MPFSHTLNQGDIASKKKQARGVAKETRTHCSFEGAAVKILNLFPEAQFKDASIAGYWPLGTELDVRPLMRCLSDNHELSLPCTPAKGEPLVFKRWSQGQKLVTGLFGTKEPVEGSECIIPDLVLVPLLAFSSRGERLGYGGGYYDRTLTNLRQQKSIFACGVAYVAQQTEIIPTNNHDALLDGILTEEYFKAF